MKSRLTLIVLALLPLTIPAAAQQSPDTPLAGIETLIEQELAEQKIPGAAVAVIRDGEIILLEGYGFRDAEENLPMTPDTMIPIASLTKQFTVSALGTLVRQGKLDWDEPVRDYLPEFRVADDYATLNATTRDLVTHRIGLPRHDWAWFGSPASREDLYGRLRYFPFNQGIRTTFQYNNFMFMTAGLLAGRLAGTSYEDYVESSLFEPVGLTRTNFSLAELARDADHATGYELDNERELSREPFASAEAMAPTGAINSTARDLARWMQMLLDEGEIGGERILLPSDVQSMMQPMMPVGQSMFPEFGHRMYGMGFFVQNYRGYETASHGGNMPGAAASMVLVPKENIGVVVLTNRSYARLRDGLPWEIVDRLLGLPSAGLVARYAEIDQRVRAGEEAAKSAGASDRRPNTRPSHELSEYAGRYDDPGYGPVDVRLAGEALSITYNGFTAPLEHWHYDVFQAAEDRTSELDRLRVQFRTDLAGEISGIAIPIEPSVEPVVFAKQPPAGMMERSFLEPLVGTYAVAGVDREIVLREDGVLQYVVFGNAYELVPVRGRLFRMKAFSGVSIEFLTGADGKIDRMAIHDTGSVVGPKTK